MCDTLDGSQMELNKTKKSSRTRIPLGKTFLLSPSAGESLALLYLHLHLHFAFICSHHRSSILFLVCWFLFKR
jgi:hypothetical protein